MSLLDVRDLHVTYRPAGRTPVHAVRGVSLSVGAGESIGVVGESGCGKSSLARAVLGLEPFCAGEVRFAGRSLAAFTPADWAEYRRQTQMVFQDSLGSLNPRQRVGDAIDEALRFHHKGGPDRGSRAARTTELFAMVELPGELAGRYPHELSGGQRQRVSIARALAVEPRLIVADEPVSALDVSVQASVIHLLDRLRRDLGVAFLFIAHDLAVVRVLCPVAHVMEAGVVVESGSTEDLFTHPRHPYTRSLLNAVPDVRRALASRTQNRN